MRFLSRRVSAGSSAEFRRLALEPHAWLREAVKGITVMPEFDLRYLLLIPFSLAEAFLLWALWQLNKEISKEKRRQSQIPSSVEGTSHRLFSKAI
jgi:hypothetical protein